MTVYQKEHGAGGFFIAGLLLLGQFLVDTALTMLLIYICKLQGNLKVVATENNKLLDMMHEGLLILTARDNKVMFCN